VTIILPDNIARMPERELTLSYVLQTTPGETLPILKEVLVEITMQHSPIHVWAFVAKITHKFILRLDVMRCVHGSGMLHAVTGPRRDAVMESPSVTTFNLFYEKQ
jgi:hypothetical protein